MATGRGARLHDGEDGEGRRERAHCGEERRRDRRTDQDPPPPDPVGQGEQEDREDDADPHDGARHARPRLRLAPNSSAAERPPSG